MAFVDKKDYLREPHVRPERNANGTFEANLIIPGKFRNNTQKAAVTQSANNTTDKAIANVQTTQNVNPTNPVATAAPVAAATQPQVTAANNAISDYSWYLEQMHDAKQKAAVAMLDAAYAKNAAAIDRAKESVAEQHEAARNQTAGASEQAKRNFAQYAAANGLNSGTSGQAELARNVALQGNLGAINAQEANAMANLELQRANTEADYNNAIAQAQANGDYALANSLYQEKLRVQEANLDEARYRQQLDYNKKQQEWENLFKQAQFDYNKTQAGKDNLAGYGSVMMNAGVMPSAEMLAAMGITSADAQNYINALNTQQNSTMTLSTAKDLAANGIFNNKVIAMLNKNGYDNNAINALYGYDATLATTIPQDVRNTLLNYSYGGYFTNAQNWRDLVSVYGEDALNAAGFYYWDLPSSVYEAIGTNHPEKAVERLNAIWKTLTPGQKQAAQKILADYGYQYNP